MSNKQRKDQLLVKKVYVLLGVKLRDFAKQQLYKIYMHLQQ